MPKKGKKGTKGKKGKKGKKKSCKKSVADSSASNDPMAPSYFQPPPKPGEQLIKLLTSHPVNEKEIHGVKVSTRILDNLTPQEIRDLRVVFELFDTNNDGFLSPPELRRAMKALGFKVKREEAKQLANDGSLKGLGMLDFNEFLETVIDRQDPDSIDAYDEIKKGFSMFDRDKKGAISFDDLQQACLDAKVKFKKEELQEMIEEADTNGDGLIDAEEFMTIMLQTNLF
ncbi:uncharacterized protein LOC127880972 [Dreissena polymorpha]|uniref:Sulfhydryl light chain n=1 Tax=Dreissena polymorpha TaxID=45954 RepID=A0A9D4JX87_DREPO|nr:uncharacterized protein LOC127880972 [Dreissena polymorpha]KAH3827376.1 hypothetical protein DPMN_129312 [Dreissena polymorpha]